MNMIILAHLQLCCVEFEGDGFSVQVQCLDHPLRWCRELFIRIFTKMFTIAPQSPAWVAHLPRTPTLDPKTSLFFGYRHCAFGVQASQDTLSLHKVIHLLCTGLLLGFRHGLLQFVLLTRTLMQQIQACKAIPYTTDIALQMALLSRYATINRHDVVTGLGMRYRFLCRALHHCYHPPHVLAHRFALAPGQNNLPVYAQHPPTTKHYNCWIFGLLVPSPNYPIDEALLAREQLHQSGVVDLCAAVWLQTAQFLGGEAVVQAEGLDVLADTTRAEAVSAGESQCGGRGKTDRTDRVIHYRSRCQQIIIIIGQSINPINQVIQSHANLPLPFLPRHSLPLQRIQIITLHPVHYKKCDTHIPHSKT